MKRFLLPLALFAALSGASCSHKPLYPVTGTLYITSNPSGAEVLLDGAMLRRSTPLKLDGVSEGTHVVNLRYLGYKVSKSSVTVGGGLTERLAVSLQSINPGAVGGQTVGVDATDMALDPITGLVYVASYSYNLGVYQVTGATFATLPAIPIQSGNQQYPGTKLLAVSRPAGKLYAVLASDSLVIVDIGLQQVVKRFRLPDSSRCKRVRFSDDGRQVFIADSLNRRIWALDARADTVTGIISLPGVPSDLLVDPSGEYLYVTLTNTRRILKVHARTGAVLNQSPTGAAPGGLFFDDERQRIGFCNGSAKQVVTIQLDTWTMANGPAIFDNATYAITGAFATDRTYMWLLTGSEPYWQGDVLVCGPGYLHLIYCPSQGHVFRYPVQENPVAMARSADGRYLYVLNRFSRSILVYRSDTE